MKQIPVAAAVAATVVGLVIGGGAAFATQPTKTVTKTVTKNVVNKINNNDPTTDMAKSFGAPAGQVPTTAPKVSLAGCVVWAGKNNTQGQPDWVVYTCVNPTQ